MDIYQLDYILHEPEESEGWMYLAEVPALQGCMAWGIPPDKGMYKFVDLEGEWLSGAFSVLNRWVDRGIVAS